ncbi:MAG: class I SAM-dependent methyltransferase [Myxococcota bacterium]
MTKEELLPLAVTVGGKAKAAAVARAREAAAQWRLPFVERLPKVPLGSMVGAQARAFLVFRGDGVALVDRHGELRFTPGMARLRVKRLDAGVDEDLLVRLGELSQGDAVLDCTLGLGADALVSARAVGPGGRVVGVEKSLALYALSAAGFSTYTFGPRSCRVETRHADAGEVLRQTPRGAFDVVLFDPMFERPRRSSPAFELLRRHADHTPLSSEIITEAQRVARRWVLVKGSRYSADLKKLGLTPQPAARGATVVWARLGPAPNAS